MAIISLGLESFTDLVVKDYENDGMFPVSLVELQEHENYADIQKILKQIKPDFNEENVFCLNVVGFTPKAIYGFNISLIEGKPVLSFGANIKDNAANKVELELVKVVDPEDPDNVEYQIKSGKVRVIFNPKDLNKPEGEALAYLKSGSGKNSVTIPVFVKFAQRAQDNVVSYIELSEVESIEDLTLLLGSFGTLGVKLTDLVRPFVKKGVKGTLPKPLIAEVESWEVQPKNPDHPDWEASTLFKISGISEALTADGSLITNPEGVYIGGNQASAKLVQNAKFANTVFLYRMYGGKLELRITALATKEPERNMPSNILKPVYPENEANKDALIKAIAFYNENPAVSLETIVSKFPVTNQKSLKSSNAEKELISTLVETNGNVTVYNEDGKPF
jgi:hypothetical protein